MCQKPLPAATVLAAVALAIAAASPAAAWPFSAAAPAKAAPAAPAKPTDAAPTKAPASVRAQADRQDPVIRVAFWTKEFEADPTDAQAGVGLASALRALGRFDEAADVAGRVLNAHPKDAGALMEQARAEVSANKGFYAIAPLKLVSAADPKDWRPWSLLGVAYEQNEQPALALAAHQEAVRLAPDSPQALSNCALFRATHGEPQAAEAMLRKAVAEPGAGAAERQNLALVLGLQGRIAEAEPLIRQDLPPEVANQNLAYLRSLNTPGGAATSSPARSWNAVKAAEAAQVKAPG